MSGFRPSESHSSPDPDRSYGVAVFGSSPSSACSASTGSAATASKSTAPAATKSAATEASTPATATARENIGEQIYGKGRICRKENQEDNAADDQNNKIDRRHGSIPSFILWKRLAANRQDHSFHAFNHSVIVTPCLDPGDNNLIDDSARQCVRYVAFQAVTDFDPQTPILRHYEQHQPIIDTLTSDFPRLERSYRPVFDRRDSRGLTDVHQELMARLSLVVFEALVKAAKRSGRHEIRGIRDPS
jgi:hypothetical protein